MYRGREIAKEMERRDQIIGELAPYVDRVDGKPGFSVEDRVDFARRVGLPGSETTRMEDFGYDFDLDEYPS